MVDSPSHFIFASASRHLIRLAAVLGLLGALPSPSDAESPFRHHPAGCASCGQEHRATAASFISSSTTSCDSRGAPVLAPQSSLVVSSDHHETPVSPLPAAGQCWCRYPRPSWIGHSCVDMDFNPPRVWHIKDLFTGCSLQTVTERNELYFDDYFYHPFWCLIGDVYQDHHNFYSAGSLGLLTLGIGVHAILANTSADPKFRHWFQGHVAGDHRGMNFAKSLGETWAVASTLAAVWVVDELIQRPIGVGQHNWIRHAGSWSRQSLRALLVGAPPVGILQVAIGASRPGESSAESKWKPFDDNNSVSGHTFVGAVPFIVAAKRTDNPLLKSLFYAGSGLTGVSRVYDDSHYLSQALLGWWIAYLAVEATEFTELSPLQYRVVPLNLRGVVGIGFELRF